MYYNVSPILHLCQLQHPRLRGIVEHIHRPTTIPPLPSCPRANTTSNDSSTHLAKKERRKGKNLRNCWAEIPTHLHFLLICPSGKRVFNDEGHHSHSGENEAQHEVLGEQLTLNVAKRVAWEVVIHRQTWEKASRTRKKRSLHGTQGEKLESRNM